MLPVIKFWLLYVASFSQGWNFPIYISRGHRQSFPNYDIFLSLEIVFDLTDSEDPDEMLHHGAFYLVLHCHSFK